MTFLYRWVFPLLYSLGSLLLLNTFKITDFDYIYIAFFILLFVFVVPILYWYVGKKWQLLKVR
jgi:uncharacterized paraquat-inducible protein A